MSGWLDAHTARVLVDGLVVTVGLTVVTSVLAFAIGVGVGMLRLSGTRATRVAGATFVEVFRNVPALIQIIFWAFAFPSVFPAGARRTIFFDNPFWEVAGKATGVPLPYYAVAACIGLVMNTGAHLAELFRAGVGTLPSERIDAARSLGAGRWTVFWSFLLPDGVRAAFGAISTRLIHNMKNTALASFVAVPELFHAMQASITASFRATELLTLAAVVYLGLSVAMSGLLQQIDRVLHRGRSRVGPA